MANILGKCLERRRAELNLTEPLTVMGELPFKGVKGLVELYSKLKEGVRLEKPAHCSEEL